MQLTSPATPRLALPHFPHKHARRLVYHDRRAPQGRDVAVAKLPIVHTDEPRGAGVNASRNWKDGSLSSETGRSGQAWAAFFLENHRSLTAYGLSLTGNLADAEDLIQSALTNLLRSAVRPRGAKPLALACMRNLMIDRRRADARRPLVQSLADCGLAFLAADDDPAADGEQIERVRDALAALSGPQREVIVLRLYSGLTFKESAQVLDEPMGTVTSRYARGLAELRAALERETNHA